MKLICLSMSFERLVKEVDALTYNSRSVLNALIRSVLRYGTDKGYSVVRAGTTLSLNRQHIYLLYRFYNEWAAYDFSEEGFDIARANVVDNFMSATDGDLLDEALITHAKVLYLNPDNKNNDTAYWRNKLITTLDKSALLNSSPIPINLRTPVMDENMNTTKYNQYETYLLPIGYYRSQILGYYDDGQDYSAGGKTWTFNVNEKFTVNAPTIVMGGSDYVYANGVERFKNRCQSNRGSKTYDSYSLCYGYNTKIIGDYGTVGGDNNFVINAASAHSISSSSMLQGHYGGIFAGFRNQVYSTNGATSGGEDLVVLGPHGYAANRFNTVGYYGLTFDIPDLTAIDTSCQVTVNTCDSESDFIQSIYNPSNIVRILDSKNTQTPMAWLNLRVGDRVIIYNQTINGRDYLSWHGIEFQKQYAKVTGITRGGYYYDIVLDTNVNYSQYGVNGGKITKLATSTHPNDYFGTNSTAFNYMTVAAGDNQTVVGVANAIYTSPEFMVGTGYIPAGNDLSTQYINGNYITSKIFRETGFAVARDYFFGSIGSYIEYGALRSGADREGQRRWVHTSDSGKHADMYFEVTEGTTEFASVWDGEINPDTANYSTYHTNHIGLSNTIMSIGRYTTRRENDNCIGAINFYDKDWFNDHNDVNSNKQPRNTIIEIIAQNGVRELKSNINITNGFVTASGYISSTRYNPAGSYGVWIDNPISAGLYSNTEYIAISSANTLSLYSTNSILATSKSQINFDAKYFRITSTTETLGTLALTGDAKSHAYWFGGPDDGDPVRCMYGGFLINAHNNMQAKPYIVPNAYGTDEFLRGAASDHILSSVGGNNNIPHYQSDCYGEQVQLHLPGPSYTDNIHPFITRYKKAQYDASGKETVAEILKVNKLALLEDLEYKTVWYGYNPRPCNIMYRVADIIIPNNPSAGLSWSFDVIQNNLGRKYGGEWNVNLSVTNNYTSTNPSGIGVTVNVIINDVYPIPAILASQCVNLAVYVRANTIGDSSKSSRVELWMGYNPNTYLSIMQKRITDQSMVQMNHPVTPETPDASNSYYYFENTYDSKMPDSGITNINKSTDGGEATKYSQFTLTAEGWH